MAWSNRMTGLANENVFRADMRQWHQMMQVCGSFCTALAKPICVPCFWRWGGLDARLGASRSLRSVGTIRTSCGTTPRVRLRNEVSRWGSSAQCPGSMPGHCRFDPWGCGPVSGLLVGDGSDDLVDLGGGEPEAGRDLVGRDLDLGPEGTPSVHSSYRPRWSIRPMTTTREPLVRLRATFRPVTPADDRRETRWPPPRPGRFVLPPVVDGDGEGGGSVARPVCSGSRDPDQVADHGGCGDGCHGVLHFLIDGGRGAFRPVCSVINR